LLGDSNSGTLVTPCVDGLCRCLGQLKVALGVVCVFKGKVGPRDAHWRGNHTSFVFAGTGKGGVAAFLDYG